MKHVFAAFFLAAFSGAAVGVAPTIAPGQSFEVDSTAAVGYVVGRIALGSGVMPTHWDLVNADTFATHYFEVTQLGDIRVFDDLPDAPSAVALVVTASRVTGNQGSEIIETSDPEAIIVKIRKPSDPSDSLTEILPHQSFNVNSSVPVGTKVGTVLFLNDAAVWQILTADDIAELDSKPGIECTDNELNDDFSTYFLIDSTGSIIVKSSLRALFPASAEPPLEVVHLCGAIRAYNDTGESVPVSIELDVAAAAPPGGQTEIFPNQVFSAKASDPVGTRVGSVQFLNGATFWRILTDADIEELDGVPATVECSSEQLKDKFSDYFFIDATGTLFVKRNLNALFYDWTDPVEATRELCGVLLAYNVSGESLPVSIQLDVTDAYAVPGCNIEPKLARGASAPALADGLTLLVSALVMIALSRRMQPPSQE